MKSALKNALLAVLLLGVDAFVVPRGGRAPFLRLQATRKDFVSQSLAGAAAVTGASLTSVSPALAKTKSTAWSQVRAYLMTISRALV